MILFAQLFHKHLRKLEEKTPMQIKREAGGQGEFSGGPRARRDVASQPTTVLYVALKKTSRSWEAPMR